MIFSSFGWISENFSGWNEIIQDVVLIGMTRLSLKY
jgi:hypothetical protein